MRVTRYHPVLALAVALSACSDQALTPTAAAPSLATQSAPSRATPSSTAPDRATQALAKAIAQALGKPGARAHLRDAMRSSRFTDHKLSLRDYLSSVAGRGLLAEAALASHTSTDELASIVAALPEMDLYLPFRDHRLTWRSTSDIAVAVTFDLDAPTIEAYLTDGSRRTLRLADGTPTLPLLLFHPAEPKGLIAATEPPSDGQTVQDARESGFASGASAALLQRGFVPTGPSFVMLPDDTTNYGGGGSGIAPGVYLTQFKSLRDDGWGGSVEMEFYANGWEGAVLYLGSGAWFYDSSCNKSVGTDTYSPNQLYTNLSLLIAGGISNVQATACGYQYSPRGFELRVVESDGGLNGNNDDFGRRFFYGGSIPFGAQMNVLGDYYSLGGTPSDGELSVKVKLEYK